MHTFQYRDKTITLITDFTPEEGIDWRVEIPQDNGTLKRYTLSYPRPEGTEICVNYTISVWLNGQWMQTLPTQAYYTPDLPIFYAMPVSGELAAKHAVNGLVRRLPELGGDPGRADGYLPFDQQGDLVQPVVFDIVDRSPESGVGNQDGGFRIDIINGVAPYRWKLSTASGFRYADSVYDDLAAGDYTVEVEDAQGTIRTKTVNVPLAEPVNA